MEDTSIELPDKHTPSFQKVVNDYMEPLNPLQSRIDFSSNKFEENVTIIPIIDNPSIIEGYILKETGPSALLASTGP